MRPAVGPVVQAIAEEAGRAVGIHLARSDGGEPAPVVERRMFLPRGKRVDTHHVLALCWLRALVRPRHLLIERRLAPLATRFDGLGVGLLLSIATASAVSAWASLPISG